MERRSFWRHLGLAIGLVVVMGAISRAADQKSADRNRIVLLAPSGPVLVDVRLETGSQSIRQVRNAYCDSLFKRLDVDKSDKLEPSEQALLPMFRRTGSGGSAAAQSFAVDGNLTSDGLRKYIDSQLGPLFSVEMKPPRADQTVRLLETLDANHDGVLSLEEVANSSHLLAHYDLDDDESLSVNELQPFPQSVRQAQRQKAIDEGRGSRVFVVDETVDQAPILASMASFYGSEGRVALDRCGLNNNAQSFDANKDGKLDRDELRKWMMEGEADLRLNAQWRDPSRRLPPALEMTQPTSARLVPGKTTTKQWDATLDGVPVHLSLGDNRSFAGYSVSLFITKAMTLDRDNNKYLDESEFAGLGTSSPFSAVDLNRDSMVTTDEIRTYFQSVSQLSQTKVVLTFKDDVTSLFQLMDADSSNRLSPREMLTLRERITPYDRNGNGQFDPGDFVSKYDLSMAFSIPEGMQEAGQPAMPMTGTTGGVRGTFRSGPLWYQRMDRNRDHDISWREFLGPRAKFDAVDTNHDGLISRDEAEAADAKAKTESSSAPAAETAAP